MSELDSAEAFGPALSYRPGVGGAGVADGRTRLRGSTPGGERRTGDTEEGLRRGNTADDWEDADGSGMLRTGRNKELGENRGSPVFDLCRPVRTPLIYGNVASFLLLLRQCVRP